MASNLCLKKISVVILERFRNMITFCANNIAEGSKNDVITPIGNFSEQNNYVQKGYPCVGRFLSFSRFLLHVRKNGLIPIRILFEQLYYPQRQLFSGSFSTDTIPFFSRKRKMFSCTNMRFGFNGSTNAFWFKETTFLVLIIKSEL